MDRDLEGARSLAQGLNASSPAEPVVKAIAVDVASWESQLEAFETVLKDVSRIDYVFPIAGIGERVWIQNDPAAKGFIKPDLTVLDVDLYGVMYTISLAIQQFRRQDKDTVGSRGKSQSSHRLQRLVNVNEMKLTS